MSKLGYLESRAPKAMFSRSRNTAMVASEVVVGIRHSTRCVAPRHRRLKPIEIEADAHPFGIGQVGRHLVTQPTLEQHQMPGSSGNRDPGAVPRSGMLFAR